MNHFKNKKIENNKGKYFVPISMRGTIIPIPEAINWKQDIPFKFITSCGVEYFVGKPDQWINTLEIFKWETVKIIGQLDSENLIIYPDRIIPDDPGSHKLENIEFKINNKRKNFSNYKPKPIIFPELLDLVAA